MPLIAKYANIFRHISLDFLRLVVESLVERNLFISKLFLQMLEFCNELERFIVGSLHVIDPIILRLNCVMKNIIIRF